MLQMGSKLKLFLIIFAIVVVVGLAAGGLYLGGSILLPNLIHSSYTEKNCEQVLQHNQTLKTWYPESYISDTGTEALVQECALYTVAQSQEGKEEWEPAYQSYKRYAETFQQGLFVEDAKQAAAKMLLAFAGEQKEQGKYDEAAATALQILKEYPDSPEADKVVETVTSIYTEQGMYDEAVAALQGITRDYPNLPVAEQSNHVIADIYLQAGEENRKQGKYADSESSYHKLKEHGQKIGKEAYAQSANTGLAETYLAWGQDMQTQQEYAKALEKYNQAIAADKSSGGPGEKAKAQIPNLHTEWGENLLSKDQFNEAIDQYKKAIAVSPSSEQAALKDKISAVYLAQAKASAKQEDFLKAIEQVKQAKEQAGGEEAKAAADVALQETYLAFSKSSGKQAQKAMADAVRNVCERKKAPTLPIFGLDKEKVGTAFFGVDITSYPDSIKASTPGSLHFVSCVERSVVIKGSRELPTVIGNYIVYNPAAGLVTKMVREQVIWKVSLININTLASAGSESFKGGEPPAMPEVTKANIVAIVTGGRYQAFRGSDPDINEIAQWILKHIP